VTKTVFFAYSSISPKRQPLPWFSPRLPGQWFAIRLERLHASQCRVFAISRTIASSPSDHVRWISVVLAFLVLSAPPSALRRCVVNREDAHVFKMREPATERFRLFMARWSPRGRKFAKSARRSGRRAPPVLRPPASPR
jgi:hypothetical protein